VSDFLSIAEIVVVPIAIAMITAGSSLILLFKSNKKQSDKMKVEAVVFRDENTAQHNDNKALLSHLSSQMTGIDKKVDRLDERLDSVQIWQVEHENVHLTEQQKKISDS
jgi:aspartate oxidase